MVNLLRYGRREEHSIRPNLDTVHVSNEDWGFNASLVTTVNDNFETSIPYPQEWDQDTEVMTMYQMWGWLQTVERYRDDAGQAVLTALSMIDRSPAATFTGVATDAEDEYLKSLFTPMMFCGPDVIAPSAASNITLVPLKVHNNTGWDYVPQLPVPTIFPVFVDIINTSLTVDLAGTDSSATFADFERYQWDYWYTVRRMTSRERSFIQGLPGVQQRWAQLGS